MFTEAFAQVSLSYANGDILVSTPTGVDTVRSVEHFVFGDGDYDVGDDGRIVAVAAMRLAAGADAATLTGGGGDDTLTGGAFNDQLEGGGRSDVIFGGGGDDTAVYQGFSRDYAINFDGPSGDGQISGGPEGGLDTLAGVEALRFADGTFSFELHGEAAEIYRLYDAFLGRAPDDAGIIAYLDFLKSGHSLADMANAAAQSAEFLSHTAALNDTQFVQYVYETALHRAPDAAGLREYVTDLQLGLFTRTSLILQAAESPEHVALTAPAIEAHGLWEPDAVNDQILLLYDAAIQREPDAFGLAAYGALLRSGTTAREIANQMASSAEFLAHHAAQNDADFINSLYQAEVGRAADPSGLEHLPSPQTR